MTCLFWAIIALLAGAFLMCCWLFYSMFIYSPPQEEDIDTDLYYPFYPEEKKDEQRPKE